MAKTIKGRDIIEDNHLANAVKSAADLKAAYDDINKSVVKLKESAKGLSKSATGISVADIKATTQAYQESSTAVKASVQIQKQLAAAEDEVVKGKIRLQQATATQKKLLTEEIALEDKQIGTLKKLSIENARLTRERSNLNLETKKGADRLTEINKIINKNNDLIKRSSDIQQQGRLNVGQYNAAVGKLTSGLNQLGIGLSVFVALRESFQTIVDFEKATASLSSITGITGEGLVDLKEKVMDLSKELKVSATDTTKLFEIVGSQSPQFLSDSEALLRISKSAITLSKASGDSIENSTMALTSMINQFNLGADDAERAMNVLAAGSLVGSAGVTDLSESMKNAGSVLAGANVPIEKSVALLEVLGKYGVAGAEAGTKLRGSMLKLQQAGMGYASGQFDVNDALEEAKQKLDSYNTALEQDAFLQKTFGAENISTGRILLSNIGLFEEYTKGVTGTSVATDQAAINSDTMAVVIKELKAAFDNVIISWSDGTDVLGGFKTILRFVADNMELILGLVMKGVTAWGSYRIGLMLVNKEGTGLIQVLGNMIKALPAATASVKNFGAAIKSVGFAGWLSILSVLLPMLWDMGKAIYNAFNEVTALDRVTEKLNKRMDEEKAKMDVLLVQIRATTAGSADRQKIITQINDTYGTTLQNLKDETMFMTQLAYAYQKVVAQMEKKIKAQLIEEELTNAFKAQREAQKQLADVTELDRYEFTAYTKILEQANKDINSLQKELFALNDEMTKSGKALGEDISPRMQIFNEQADTSTKKVKESTEAIKDWRLELDKAMGTRKRTLGVGATIEKDKDKSTMFGTLTSFISDYAEPFRAAAEEQKRLEEEALERRRRAAQETIDLIELVRDARVRALDDQIAKENQEVEASRSAIDYLREQAKLGNTDAAASIKAEEVAQAKNMIEIEKLEKKKRNLLIETAALTAVINKFNSGDSNAFANAGSDIAKFLANLPKFFEGTETTVAEALGKPHLNTGKDAYLTRVDGSEMILNGRTVGKLQSAGLNTTSDVANAALAYSSRVAQMNSGSRSLGNADVVSAVKENTAAIKEIPIPDLMWDEGEKALIHKIKIGNKVIANHYKSGGLFSK